MFFDDNSYEPIVSRSVGTQGSGISPIMLSSYTHFMLAEAALKLGTTGDALTYLLAGVEQSIDSAMAFGVAQAAGSGFEPSATDVDYIDEVEAKFILLLLMTKS